jgi:Exopolyphosphatase-related proteins
VNEFLKKINEYHQIVIYRHIRPDLDAFGSQLGMYYLVKDNFKDKRIVIAGKRDSQLCSMFLDFDENEYCNDEKTLGIVLDTANRDRIDGDYLMCDEIIKIDHHIIVDHYGSINIIDESASSCSQIIVEIYHQFKDQLTLSKEAASALYKGMVGDSNRFLYRNTDEKTFRCAATLVETGISIEDIYQELYLKDEKELLVTQFILNHYHVNNGVAYYILKDEDLKGLGITREEGSNYVNTLSNVREFQVWMAITENKVENNYRVSIRSRSIPIDKVANMFHGGGHALASGASLDDLDQLDELVRILKEKLNG